MKSLILKDIYNIAHNAKAMIVILLVFAFCFIPSSGAGSFVALSTLLCATMVVTTFSFDENSQWMKYAMIMPLPKEKLVASKFCVALIFSLIGALIGLVIGIIGNLLIGATGAPLFYEIMDFSYVCELLLVALASLSIAALTSGTTIALILKFGIEKGRILLLAGFLIPLVCCLILYQALSAVYAPSAEHMVFALVCCLPFVALLLDYLLYKISCNILSHQDI